MTAFTDNRTADVLSIFPPSSRVDQVFFLEFSGLDFGCASHAPSAR
jgi:hypothetical protein